MDSLSSAIKIENIWKIFGNNSKEALNAIQNNKISKTEALEKYNSVIGVSDVSFDVKQGEIFCVMGLSGSGKSTLVRHINRLLEPTSGKILINNQDVMTLDRESLQELRNKKIGMVFQNFALMPHRSVVDNIAMPLEIRGISKNDRLDSANKILDIVELQGWGNKFAHELSGGMQQRVGLARALASALARPTLCCIPPDSSCANLFPQPCNSTISKILFAESNLSFLLIPLISSGIAMLSTTDLWGINAKF